MSTHLEELQLGLGQAKIVGGIPAAEGRFGFQAAVLNNDFQFCAGSLVAPNVVLTAAHCAGQTATDVALGCTDISDLSQCDVIPVISSDVFANFNADDFLIGDVQLLTLARDSTEESITLTAPEFDIADGQDLTVIGWGVTNPAEQAVSNKLLEINVELFNEEECNSQYEDLFSFLDGDDSGTVVNDFKFCAAADGKDSCQGDSGGPIFLRCDSSNEDVQVGVVSFGIGCAHDGIPGIYAKLANSQIFDFIDQVVVREGHSLKTIASFSEFCVVNGTQPAESLSDPPTPFPTFDLDAWSCNPDFFASADGCDCNCGILDPDCEFEDLVVFNCNSGEKCDLNTATCDASPDIGGGSYVAIIAAGIGGFLLISLVLTFCLVSSGKCKRQDRIQSKPKVDEEAKAGVVVQEVI